MENANRLSEKLARGIYTTAKKSMDPDDVGALRGLMNEFPRMGSRFLSMQMEAGQSRGTFWNNFEAITALPFCDKPN